MGFAKPSRLLLLPSSRGDVPAAVKTNSVSTINSVILRPYSKSLVQNL
jgi:predicted Na+-dependent transporter